MRSSLPFWRPLFAVISLSACSSLLAQFPDAAPAGNAQKNGAPNWVKPGTRITYYASAASVMDGTQPPETLTYQVEDVRASGQAFVQVNVVDLDRQSAVLEIRTFSVDVGTGQIQLPKTQGWTGAADTGQDYWIHPSQLKGMQDELGKKMTVTRAPLTLNGKTYNSIRILTKTGNNSMSKIYDLDSGVLLMANVNANRRPNPKNEDDERGNPALGHMRLMAIRDVNLPWNGMTAPDWVGKVHTLTYGGAITTVVRGGISPRYPHKAEFKFNRTGAKWAQVTESSETTAPMGMPAEFAVAERVFGTSQVGGIWIPPAALARLQPGLLDHDQITRTQFSYLGTKGNAAYFNETGPSATTQYAYDRNTGVLTELATTMPVGGVTMQVYVSLQRSP